MRSSVKSGFLISFQRAAGDDDLFGPFSGGSQLVSAINMALES